MNTRLTGLLLAAVMIACVQFGCNKQEDAHSHGDDHAADHAAEHEEEKTAVMTVWTEDFEAFIEHDYLLVHTPTKFITHISNLNDSTPRTQGSITYQFTGSDGLTFSHKSEKIARSGIYLPMIKFPSAGKWKAKIKLTRGDKSYEIPLPDRTVYANEHDVAHAPGEEEIDGITYLKEQQWVLGTTAMAAGKRTLKTRIDVMAKVSTPEECEAHILAPVQGQLSAAEGQSVVNLGDMVKKGQLLAQITPNLSTSDLVQLWSNQLTAQATRIQLAVTKSEQQVLLTDLQIKKTEASARVERANAKFAESQRTLERVEKLFEKKAKSKRELYAARFANSTARSELEVAKKLRKQLEAIFVEIKKMVTRDIAVGNMSGFSQPQIQCLAPIDGVIVERTGTLGQLFPQNAQLFRIVDPSKVVFTAFIPEQHVTTVSKEDSIFFFNPRTKKEVELAKVGGSFRYLSPEINQKTRTVSLAFTVPNDELKLKIGETLHAEIALKESKNVLAIPATAIVEEEGDMIAFVHVSGETYQRRQLTVGIRSGDWVEIQDGIKEGERVVVRGAYNIRLASLSSKLPAHGHAH